MSYGNTTFFTPSALTVSGGTITENTGGGIHFSPSSANSYVEFTVDAPTIRINLTNSSPGVFTISVNGKKVGLKERFNANIEFTNYFLLRTDGQATVRLQPTMSGVGDYGIDLISYQIGTEPMPFEITDLAIWKDALKNKYLGNLRNNYDSYWGRFLCSLYEREPEEAVLSEIIKIADYYLLLQSDDTKRFSSAGALSNGSILHFVYRAYQVTGDERYRQACLDMIEYNFIQGNWAKSTVYPRLFLTTPGATVESIVYNHNYFLGESLVFVGQEEANEQYISLGLDQFLGSSSAISEDGSRGHSSTNKSEYRNYRYIEALQNLRTGYDTSNAQLIADGKKLLKYAENMTEQGEPRWLLQDRYLDINEVYMESVAENISLGLLPYYYMIKNGDYNLDDWKGKEWAVNGLKMYDPTSSEIWFSRNFHSDYYLINSCHQFDWYFESGLYDDLEIDKELSKLSFSGYELVPVEDKKLRFYRKNGRIEEYPLSTSKHGEIAITLKIEGVDMFLNMEPVDGNGRVKVMTSEGVRQLSKFK